MAIFKIETEIIGSTEKEKIRRKINTKEDYKKPYQDFIEDYSSSSDSRFDGVVEIELTKEEWNNILATLPNDQQNVFFKEGYLYVSDKYKTMVLEKDNNVYLNEIIFEKDTWTCKHINEIIIKIIRKVVKPKYNFYEPTLNPLILHYSNSKDRTGSTNIIVAYGMTY